MKRFITITITIILAVILTVAAPTYAESNCKAFTDSIEYSVKYIAFYEVMMRAEDSAPRATLNEIKIANQIARIQINLTLMQANKCKMPSAPIINKDDYWSNVINCSAALMSGKSPRPECNVDTWVRHSPKETTTQKPKE